MSEFSEKSLGVARRIIVLLIHHWLITGWTRHRHPDLKLIIIDRWVLPGPSNTTHSIPLLKVGQQPLLGRKVPARSGAQVFACQAGAGSGVIVNCLGYRLFVCLI